MADAINIEKMEKRIESLEAEIRRLKSKPTGAVGTLLLAIGLLLLALAIIVEHNISAFIGIALTFWGALLLYIRPTSFVRKEILDALAIESLTEMAEVVDKLGYQGKPFYASPRTILGIRRTNLVIPRSTSTKIEEDTSLEELAVSPTFMVISPPGQGLSNLIEEELKINFSATDLEYVANNLEKALVEGLEMVESFEMERKGEEVKAKFKGSTFFDVAERINSMKLNPAFCDPMTSAFACILARSTGNRVTVDKVELKHGEKTIISIYKLHE